MIKEGRFGPYITDGEYNATVPRGETPEAISVERAFELLADKRAQGPAKKKAGSRTKKAGATKKAARKSTAARKRSS